MPQLFAEAFAEPLQEPTHPRPDYAYDESRSLSLLTDGRVFVEHAASGETATVTEATGEQDDRDDVTETKAFGEVDTFRMLVEGTHTAVDPEADDWAAADCATDTRVSGEADDWTA